MVDELAEVAGGVLASFWLYSVEEITRVGAGVEFFPLKDDRVRLHANYSYAFGHNTTPHAVVRPKQSYFDIGLTWRMKIL